MKNKVPQSLLLFSFLLSLDQTASVIPRMAKSDGEEAPNLNIAFGHHNNDPGG